MGLLRGKDATLPDVVRLFAEIPRSAMTTILCRLGATFEADDPEQAIEADRLFWRPLLLAPELQRLVDAFDQSQDSAAAGVAFCRPQVLLALRLAQHLCPEGDAPTIPPDMLQRIGSALLHVSSLLVDDEDTGHRPGHPQDEKKYVAAMMLSLFESSNPPISIHSMRRTFTMVEPALELRARTAASERDLSYDGRPERQGVLPPSCWPCREARFSEGPWPHHWAEMGEILRLATTREGIRKALEHISIPYAELPTLTPVPKEALRDPSLRPFRSRPLIALPGDNYLCTDMTFLRLLITTGLFWKLRELLHSSKEQNELFQAWGYLFEDYVHDTLEPAIGPKRYRRSPLDLDGNEITDAIVDYGSDVVLFEVKAVLVRDDLKYGRDLDAILAVLDARLLKDGQLVRAMTRLFHPKGPREATRHLQKRFAQRLYPVIVTYDHSICSPFIADYLNAHLQDQLAKAGLPKHPIVQPLTLMAADDINLLVPLLKHGMRLPRMLREYAAFQHLGVAFHNYLFDAPRSTGQPFMLGPEYARFLDESLSFWKEQELPHDLSW